MLVPKGTGFQIQSSKYLQNASCGNVNRVMALLLLSEVHSMVGETDYKRQRETEILVEEY